ncbi:MAG: hypothetical protein E6H09_21905 [Bacteroidetes bacterium]|nr:MAG: hypothetical protein E6H09_21905 [Bacteroidota bacterium]
MNEYFAGAVRQLIRRSEHLLIRIKSGLSSEYHLLEKTCREDLSGLIQELAQLINTPETHTATNDTITIRTYRRLVGKLDELETFVIPVLSRSHDDDRFLNRLVQQIRREINYPLLPPVVSPFSQNYFYILGEYNLICVPLEEGNFLLHLPDIYHEMAHPLEWAEGYPAIQGFQISMIEFLDEAKSWLNEELQREGSGRGGSELNKIYLRGWKRDWENWGREFFCDIFATATLGPAYAWSHFHLSAMRGGNPFDVPRLGVSTHPADDARMRAILDALCICGFDEEAQEIETRWRELISALGFEPEPEYLRCYPTRIIKLLSEKALHGIRGMNCRIVTGETNDVVHRALNDAWRLFWIAPADYAQQEGELIQNLRRCVMSE